MVLSNYIKLAFRNILKYKSFYVLNLTCLVIGMASFLLIFLDILHELNFDRFHVLADRIFRVATTGLIGQSPFNTAASSPAIMENLLKDFPEVESGTRISQSDQSQLITFGENRFYEKDILYVDSSFLSIFSFKMTMGNKYSALTAPYSIVLTKSLSEKLFGSQDPLNKQLQLNDDKYFTVTGIVENPPSQSHIQFHALCSFSTLYAENGNESYSGNWGFIRFYSYILLTDNNVYNSLTAKLDGYIKKYAEQSTMDAFLQPLKTIYLYSDLTSEFGKKGDIITVFLLTAVAFFVLILTLFTYSSLSITRVNDRSREIGLRKAFGVSRLQLFIQFIVENGFIFMLSSVISILLLLFLLPFFNRLVEFDLLEAISWNTSSLLYSVSAILLLGLLTALYPAIRFSSLAPTIILQRKVESDQGKVSFNSFLLVLQYMISIILIISSLIVFTQLNYVKEFDLGFSKEKVLVVPLRNKKLKGRIEYYESEFRKMAEVESISASSNIPGDRIPSTGFIPEEFKDEDKVMIAFDYVDFDFEKTLQLNLTEGRSFSRMYSTDTAGVIINQSLKSKLGWQDPLGKIIKRPTNVGERILKVIGVIKDPQYRSLYNPTNPMVFYMDKDNLNYLCIRLKNANYNEIQAIKNKWDLMEPAFPFDSFLLEDYINHQYREDTQTGRFILYFTIITIIITCLGLIAMISFLLEKERKSIALRKVYGASPTNIVVRVLIKFVRFILIALVFAFPIAWYAMAKWLEKFAFKTSLYWWIFVLASFISLAIALITIFGKAIRAANQNPVYNLHVD